MKYISIFILLNLAFANCIFCQSETLSIGKYRNKRCNSILRVIHESFVPEDLFILYANQSYESNGCNSTQYGTWVQKNDTLILTCTSHKYKVDSLNRVGFKGRFAQCPDPQKYLVKSSKRVKSILSNRCYFLED